MIVAWPDGLPRIDFCGVCQGMLDRYTAELAARAAAPVGYEPPQLRVVGRFCEDCAAKLRAAIPPPKPPDA